MPDSPLITLTTDFGYDDPFSGVMKGVILKINPQAKIIDLTHGIRPHNILEASYIIGTSYSFYPDGTIHIVVVDPGVGSERRPLIMMTDHQYFIGPDNGVFSHIYGRPHDILEVRHITSDHYFSGSKSPTFQGRDVFAPVAAWLSRGIDYSKFGEPVTDYREIPLHLPAVSAGGVLKGEVIYIDRFGNAITNITRDDIDKLFGSGPGGLLKIGLKGRVVPMKGFYSQSAEKMLGSLINSSGYLEFFVFKGNASSEYSISIGDIIEVTIVNKPA